MTTSARPSDVVLAAFGIDRDRRGGLENLPGGRGLTWRLQDIVLRPSAGDGETTWKADVLSRLPDSVVFRTPRPIASTSSTWTIDGWEAWQWLPGAEDPTRVADVLAAAAGFHDAVSGLDRPAFLDLADDPWASADRIAWEEDALPSIPTLQQLAGAFRAVRAPSQIIHGDLLGNVMFDPRHPPAIIDWAPYWRPVGYADAIALVDAVCWHGLAPSAMLEVADGIRDGRQHLVRALVFRIATLELLGRWDAAMAALHTDAVDAALS